MLINFPPFPAFWPSIRPLVSSYIALAADFHGTDESYFMCSPLKVGAYVLFPFFPPSSLPPFRTLIYASILGVNRASGSKPSARITSQPRIPLPHLEVGEKLWFQQLQSTLYVLLLYLHEPATDFWTTKQVTDDVIQPETPPFGPTSYLEGAVVLALQDLSVCGPSHQASHFSMVFDPAAFGLAKNALENPSGMADVGEFDRLYCTYLSKASEFLLLKELSIAK